MGILHTYIEYYAKNAYYYFIQFPLFKSIINMSGYYRLVFLE